MNKVMVAVAFLLCSSPFVGCKKANDTSGQKTITAIIKKNTLFQYELGHIGKDDAATISLPPRHATISELKRENNGKAIYHYKPVSDFIGRDQVELTCDISNGAVVLSTHKTKLIINVEP